VDDFGFNDGVAVVEFTHVVVKVDGTWMKVVDLM